MSAFQDKIRNPDCELCELHKSAEHVCLMGTGSKKSKIMIVGEAPGEREDDEHQAFVGSSGQLLTKVLKKHGISREECYITNAAKCRPPENRTPTKPEIKICSTQYLSREVEKVRPDYILTLGNSALLAVLGRSGITKYRSQVVSLQGQIRVYPTYHPAAVLRNPKYKDEFQADIRDFANLVRGKDTGLRPTSTRLVLTKAGLREARQELMKAEVISYDIETTGLNEWADDAAIVSVAFTTEEGRAVCIPLFHKTSPFRKNWKEVLLYLKPGFERDVKYVAHNGKFDCRYLARFGVFVNQTFDTMLAAHILDENRSKGLKPLSQVYLGAPHYDDLDKTDLYNAPIKKLAIYNGKDTDYTYRLYKIFKAQLKEEPRIARVFKFIMMPASNAMTKVEATGMYVHEDRRAAQEKKVNLRRKRVMKELLKYVPKHKRDEINFNSPQQVGAWVFGDLKLPILERTKTKQPSTNESVMLRLAAAHPAPKLLLEYRGLTKNLNTYLEPWDRQRDSRGRIHTNYKLFGTVTGRLSSEKPNLQQVPREGTMRTCFGAPPGWLFVEADYSQVELRVAAMVAQDREMLRLFAIGEDIHLATAVRMTGKRPEDITSEERKKAKAVNFGFLYGMGEEKFIIYARDNYGVEVTPYEAHVAREAFFSSYLSLRPWHDRQRRLVARYGRVHSPLGRVRHLPDVRSSDKAVRAEAERQAINSPVQSFASDLMLLSLVRLDPQLSGLTARVVGSVHDALLFEVRKDALLDTCKLIRTEMEDMSPLRKQFGTKVTVPIEVELKVGQYWGGGEIYTDDIGM